MNYIDNFYGDTPYTNLSKRYSTNLTYELLVLFFLFMILSVNSALADVESHTACALLKKDLKIKKKGSILRRGFILPILKRKGDHFIVNVYGQKIQIKKQYVKLMPQKICQVQPKCFEVTAQTSLYTEPSMNGLKTRELEVGDKVAWSAVRTNKNNQKWYQIFSENQYYWLPDNVGDISSFVCEDASRSTRRSDQKWHFSLGVTSGLNVSAESYENIITVIRNASDVACEQDPLFTSIEKGQSLSIQGKVLYHLNPWLALTGGIGFERTRFELNYLDNPHPDPGNTSCFIISKTLADLSGGSKIIEEENLHVPLGTRFLYRLGLNHHLSFSAQLLSVFNLKSLNTIRYLTGETLSKQTENFLEIEIDPFRYSYSLGLGYIYNFPFERGDVLGIHLYFEWLPTRHLFGLEFIF